MKARLSKKAVGRVVLAGFRDHVENLPESAWTEAVGRLMGYDRKEIHLCSWRYPRLDLVDGETHYRILRSTIESLEILG